MTIGGIVFSLTAMRIRSVAFRCATTVIGINVFRHTTLAIHNNQPKEGRPAKMPATEAKQLATTSRRIKRTKEPHNTNARATTVPQWWQQW
jgi:hypothetical protein